MGRVHVYEIANETAARHVDAQAECRSVNSGVTRRARSNLARQKTADPPRITDSGYFPATISSSEGDIDHYTTLTAPNAVALEFGHAPSGKFAGTPTKSPDPTYILTRAAIGGTVS